MVVLALSAACSDDEPVVPPIEVPPPAPAEPVSDAPAAQPAYEVSEVPAGVLEGVVRWRGPRPRNPTLDVHAQHRTCGRSQEVPAIAISRSGGVAHAVVSVQGVQSGPRPLPSEPAVVDQVGCRYVPHTLGAVRGMPITFRNSDDVLHNVHAIWQDGSEWFNVGQPRAGTSSTETPERTGVARLVCDAGHQWMLAWIHVFDHPYFAVTDEEGRFRIEGVPAGERNVRLWHQGWERAGAESGRPLWSDPVEVVQTVQVPAGGSVAVEFVLPPE